MISAEAIRLIIDEQISGYKTLRELLQKERECLVSFDSEAIEELSKTKDTLLFRLRLLEEERIRLVDELACGNISLTRLSEITGDERFSVMRSTLLSLVQGIEELNEFNRILIDRSLTYIKNSTKFIVSSRSGNNGERNRSALSMEI